MSIKVTREQVSAARIVHALDKAEGRKSDEWVLRLIEAKDPSNVVKIDRELHEKTPRGGRYAPTSKRKSSDSERGALKSRAKPRRGKGEIRADQSDT